MKNICKVNKLFNRKPAALSGKFINNDVIIDHKAPRRICLPRMFARGQIKTCLREESSEIIHVKHELAKETSPTKACNELTDDISFVRYGMF